MGSVVQGVLTAAWALREAIQNAPLLQKRCKDFASMLDQVDILARELENKEQTPDSRAYCTKLQAALERAYKVVRQGQAGNVGTLWFLVSSGGSFAKELEVEFQNIQLLLTQLNMWNTLRLVEVTKTSQDTYNLCRQIDDTQGRIVGFLRELVMEFSKGKSKLGDLAWESRRAIENGNFDRQSVEEGVLDTLIKFGAASSSIDDVDRDQLREQFATEIRGGGRGRDHLGVASRIEYEPGDKGSTEGIILPDDTVEQLFQALDELSRSREQLEKERQAKIVVEQREEAKAEALRTLQQEKNKLLLELNRTKDELRGAERRYELTTSHARLSDDLKLFYDKLLPKIRQRRAAESPSVEIDDNYPSAFICVICQNAMDFAVVLPSGTSCCKLCAEDLFNHAEGNLKCPVTQRDIHRSYTENHNLRQVKESWETELSRWIEKQEAQLETTLSELKHSSSGKDVEVPPIDRTVSFDANPDVKDPEVNEQVQKLLGNKKVTGALGLNNLLKAKRGRWKQVYNAGGVKPLVEALADPSVRRIALEVLELVVNEAVKEATKEDGDTAAATDACQNIAEDARLGLAQVLGDWNVERPVKATAARILGDCCLKTIAMPRELILGNDNDNAGVILGLVQLGFPEVGNDKKGDGSPSTQELCWQILCQLAEVPTPAPLTRSDVILPLFKLTSSSANRIEALRALTWVADEAAKEGDAKWAVNILLANDWHRIVSRLLRAAANDSRLRLAVCECVASLCRVESMALAVSQPVGRNRSHDIRTGLDHVLDLLEAVVEEIKREPTLNGLMCAVNLIRVVTLVAVLKKEESQLPLLERGIEPLLHVLGLTDRWREPAADAPGATSSAEGPSPRGRPPVVKVWSEMLVGAARAMEKLTEISDFAEPILHVHGAEVLASILHQNVETAEAAMGALTNLMCACPEGTALALRGLDFVYTRLCDLVQNPHLSCRLAAVQLLRLLAQGGGESSKSHIARVVSFGALKRAKWDSLAYQQASSSLGASLSKYWDSDEDVKCALDYVLSLLRAALEDQHGGSGVRKEGLRPSSLAQGKVADLVLMLNDRSKTGLVFAGLLDNAALFVTALESSAVPGLAQETTGLVVCLIEAAVQIGEREHFDKLKVFVNPLLEFVLELSPQAGAEGQPRVTPTPGQGAGKTRQLAYQALDLLMRSAPQTPWIEDVYAQECVRIVLRERRGPSCGLVTGLLRTLCKEQGHRRGMIRECGMEPQPLIEVVKHGGAKAQRNALGVICALAEEAPALYAGHHETAILLAALLSYPDAELRQMAVLAVGAIAESKAARASLSKYASQLTDEFVSTLLKALRAQEGILDVDVGVVVAGLLSRLSELDGFLFTEECVDALVGALLAATVDSENTYKLKRWCLSALQNFVPSQAELVGRKIHERDSVACLGSLLAESHTQGTTYAPHQATGILGDSAAYLLRKCVVPNSPAACICVAEPLGVFLSENNSKKGCNAQALALAEALWSTQDASVHGELATHCGTPLTDPSAQGCPAKGTPLACSGTCDKKVRELRKNLEKVIKDKGATKHATKKNNFMRFGSRNQPA